LGEKEARKILSLHTIYELTLFYETKILLWPLSHGTITILKRCLFNPNFYIWYRARSWFELLALFFCPILFAMADTI